MRILPGPSDLQRVWIHDLVEQLEDAMQYMLWPQASSSPLHCAVWPADTAGSMSHGLSLCLSLSIAAFLRRIILVSNHLPIRATKREETASWEFEWDEDALIYQAQACCQAC